MIENLDSESSLCGLILAGGESSRMGTDKSDLVYHGLPQVKYLFDLLSKKTSEVFISVRAQRSFDFTDCVIADSLEINGPLNGIISAFEQNPDTAWLVLAVDLPFLDEQNVDHLIASREVDRVATTLTAPGSKVPEPLIAIWESRSYAMLKQEISTFGHSPKKFLLNHDVALVEALGRTATMNVNNQSEFKEATALLSLSKKSRQL